MADLKQHDWHALHAEQCLQLLAVHDAGLSDAQAAQRLQQYGANRLPQKHARGPVWRFLRQFHNLLIYVLLATSLLTLALGAWLDSAVIFCVVLINALVGFIQEGKAEQAMRAIQQMLCVESRVRRAGKVVSLPAEQLVPGDLVLLEAGERVSADLRLLEARELRIDEAALTGESLPVAKQLGTIVAQSSLGDRSNMAYSGTLVTAGSGCGLVVASAGDTELGRISHLLGSVDSLQTPLLADVERLARQLTFIIMTLAVLTFGFGMWLHDYSANEMLMAAVSLAVTAIPEGLPAVLTIILALGVQRMSRRHAIIRRLPAVESLGAVSVICSDKTGTLTRNEMTVQQVFTVAHQYQVDGVGYAPIGSIHCDDGQLCVLDSADDLRELARAGLLANSAGLHCTDECWSITGDPTEAALLTLAGKLGLEYSQEVQSLPRVDAIPFSAEQRCSASLHHDHAGHGLIYLIGAPEQLFGMCNRQWRDGRDEALDLRHWHAALELGASQGLRMLGLALRSLPQVQHELCYADVQGDFVMLGLVGMLDPPRDEAIRAIAQCHAAGIQVKMITGDHAATAGTIAARLGLGDAAVISGAELDELDDAALDKRLSATHVFARTSPAHKLRLVERLQAAGERVAMTGDGVNDAPALKRADIGIAMGIKGTEVAKEAAEIVLADDNFATIAHAVEEGRTVYANLQKSILFILPTGGAEAVTLLTAIVLGMTLPITPLQILWVNMITAVTLSLALAFEPAESGQMLRPPRDPRQPLLRPALIWRIVLIALLMAVICLGFFSYSQALGWSVETSRTLVVNAMVACEMGYLFSCRSLDGWARLSWRDNPLVWAMVLLLAAMQLAFSYWGGLQQLFATADLPLQAWAACLLIAITVCALVELEKLLLRRWSGWRRRVGKLSSNAARQVPLE